MCKRILIRLVFFMILIPCALPGRDGELVRLAARLLDVPEDTAFAAPQDDPQRLVSGPLYTNPPSAADLRIMRKRIAELEPLVLAAFSNRHPTDLRPALALVLLGSDWVVPLLVARLLTFSRLYGWEGPDYRRPATYLKDGQYPWQSAWLALLTRQQGRRLKRLFPAAALADLAGKAARFAALPDKPVDEEQVDLETLGYAAWLWKKLNQPEK